MGGTKWSDDSFQQLKATRSTQTTNQIFTSKSLHKDLDAKGIEFRESRDSDAHPLSVAIIVALDVTGSMGHIPEDLVRHKFGTLMTTLINHKVEDAHVLFAAVGDHYTDTTPLQVGQFEAGTKELDADLSKIYLEGGGGGQIKESYALAWLFAGRYTTIDCFEKRSEKGFLFTIGDEGCHEFMQADALNKIFGDGTFKEEHVTCNDALREAERLYNVFHIHVNEGSYKNHPDVLQQWKGLLGERLIVVDDYTAIAEVIASTVAVMRGADLNHVVNGFDSHTAKIVTNALVKVSSGVVKHKDGVLSL